MNGIGVTQWQNNETEYPLKGAGNLSGIFCDATFVSYNNFIPVLTGIAIIGANLSLSFNFDNGSNTFNCPISSATCGASLKLSDGERTYGTVVFGRLIQDIAASVYGSSIVTNIPFDPITVRTINTSNGVYSINGLTSDVTIALDANMTFNGSSFNAVSIPSNLNVVYTTGNNLYLYTSNYKLLELDLATSSITDLVKLDLPYTGIVNTGTELLGAYSATVTNLYNLATIPATTAASNIVVGNAGSNILGFAIDNSSNIWALSSANKLCKR